MVNIYAFVIIFKGLWLLTVFVLLCPRTYWTASNMLMTVLAAPRALKATITCPTDYQWNQQTRRCYKFATDRITWRMAREKCRAQGGDVISITSPGVQQFVTDRARKNKGTNLILMRGLVGGGGVWYLIKYSHFSMSNSNLDIFSICDSDFGYFSNQYQISSLYPSFINHFGYFSVIR